MIVPLIEFGGAFFFFALIFIGLVEASFVYRRDGASAITLLIVTCVVVLSVVDGLPSPKWQWFAGYFAGAFVWVPIYWYLILRRNRRGLLDSRHDSQRVDYGQFDAKGKRWLPKHPEVHDIAANGLLWFMAAPIHAAQDWINIVIDMFSGLMGRIQSSLAVSVEVRDE